VDELNTSKKGNRKEDRNYIEDVKESGGAVYEEGRREERRGGSNQRVVLQATYREIKVWDLSSFQEVR